MQNFPDSNNSSPDLKNNTKYARPMTSGSLTTNPTSTNFFNSSQSNLYSRPMTSNNTNRKLYDIHNIDSTITKPSDFFMKSLKDTEDIKRYINESKMNQQKALSRVQTNIEQEILKN